MCYSRPMVYTYVPNFVSIGIFCRPLAAKTPQFLPYFAIFWTSAFSGGQKPQFWANFDTFGRFCSDPLLPMRAKFGGLEQTEGLHLPAKYHLNVFIVSASDGQKLQFWANFDIWGTPVLYFTDEGQIWCKSRPKIYTYTPNLILMCSLCRLPV